MVADRPVLCVWKGDTSRNLGGGEERDGWKGWRVQQAEEVVGGVGGGCRWSVVDGGA